MVLCIPVVRDEGLQSPVCGHFGSAPMFLIAESEAGTSHVVVNSNRHHGHGMCHPLTSLAGENIEAILVNGIGMGAFGKLQAANIKVYLVDLPTVEDVLNAFKEGKLPEMTAAQACGQHGHGGGGQGQGQGWGRAGS